MKHQQVIQVKTNLQNGQSQAANSSILVRISLVNLWYFKEIENYMNHYGALPRYIDYGLRSNFSSFTDAQKLSYRIYYDL